MPTRMRSQYRLVASVANMVAVEARPQAIMMLPILAQLLQQHRPRGILRWAIDVDPLAI